MTGRWALPRRRRSWNRRRSGFGHAGKRDTRSSQRWTPTAKTIWKRRKEKNCPCPTVSGGTEGWQLNPVIREAAGNGTLLEKPTFGSVKLPALLREKTEETDRIRIELIGLCTDICVVSNALLLKHGSRRRRSRSTQNAVRA